MISICWRTIITNVELQQQFRAHHADAHSQHGWTLRVLQQQHTWKNVGQFYAVSLPVPRRIQVSIISTTSDHFLTHTSHIAC